MREKLRKWKGGQCANFGIGGEYMSSPTYWGGRHQLRRTESLKDIGRQKGSAHVREMKKDVNAWETVGRGKERSWEGKTKCLSGLETWARGSTRDRGSGEKENLES